MSYIPDRLDKTSEYYYGKLKDFERGFIECLNTLVASEDILNLDAVTDNIVERMNLSDDSLVDRIQIEIIKEFVNELKKQLNIEANEINCSFIEGGIEDE